MKPQQHPQSTDWPLWLFGVLVVISYFLHLGVNNIWTPNESFYAEAVREMMESGNYLELFYNYEPRFNKPPLLYWLIALSTTLFGMTEFAIRLPIALCGLGTIYLTYHLGKQLHSKNLGFIAAIVVAFSFQFVINARYAAPAVPLTFFFTLTLFYLVKGLQQQKFGYVMLGYLALGLTMLTKGYPYLIIISAIAGLYLLFQSQGNFKAYFKSLKFTRLWLGLPIALLIGMSWILYMYYTYGDAFYDVFMEETFRRAFTRENARLKPFFYLEANLWGFLPYSLTFYFGLGYLLFNQFKGFKSSPLLQFSFSWFLVMLVVFTIAKGKIPTYFIQGHPGMALFSAYFIHQALELEGWKKVLYQLQYWLPGIVFTLLSLLIVFAFQGFILGFVFAIIPLATLFIKKPFSKWLGLPFFPFTSFLVTYLLFGWMVLPEMEHGFRNQDQMGQAILSEVDQSELPILMEDCLIHNLPFYAQRKAIPYLQPEEIEAFNQHSRMLLVTSAERQEAYAGEFKTIWKGLHYSSSETRTLEFIIEMLKHQRGQASKFKEYVILYEEEETLAGIGPYSSADLWSQQDKITQE